MKKYVFFFIGFLIASSTFAQSDIKVMSYNVLIYPQGAMVNRIDTLSEILDFYKPDLLLLQELKSEQGLLDIEDELDELFGNYQAGTYVDQVSNQSNSWRLQQNIVYNENVFELVNEEVVVTPYRDINYFQLRILKQDGTPSQELLHTYVTHLKSSQGATNEQLRLSMAEVLYEYIGQLPTNSKVVVGGDFNVYYGGEPAYELLLSLNGTNTLHDPIDMPGWAGSNFPHREIYTQSTRATSLDDGSGGGLDDRFDFILLSEELMNPDGQVVYREDSYKALGNNGSCYNQDLINCTTDDNVPEDMIRLLYHMSDHLPIVLSLDTKIEVSVDDLTLTKQKLIDVFPNPAIEKVELSSIGNKSLDVHIFNAQGKSIFEIKRMIEKTRLDISEYPDGLYFIQSIDVEHGFFEISKLLIQSR